MILVSILVHGVVSGPIITLIERRGDHIHVGSAAEMLALSPPPRDDEEPTKDPDD